MFAMPEIKTPPPAPQPEGDRHQRLVRMDNDLAERLRLAAFQTRRYQNDIVVAALREWLDRYESANDTSKN